VVFIDEVWGRWRYGPQWISATNPHSGLLLLLIAFAALVGLIAAAAIVIWRLVSMKSSGRGPVGAYVTWIVIIAAGIATYFPSGNAFSALAVALFGPGQHSSYLQRNAAMGNSTLLLNALIMRGAAIDPQLLGSAAYNGSTSVMRRLIDLGIPVNGQYFETRVTALHQAVDRNQYASAELLLEAGAKVDVRDARGRSPIDLAILKKDERMAAILNRARRKE
jgi:hypothetical protein